jgi:hypothetical protein
MKVAIFAVSGHLILSKSVAFAGYCPSVTLYQSTQAFYRVTSPYKMQQSTSIERNMDTGFIPPSTTPTFKN